MHNYSQNIKSLPPKNFLPHFLEKEKLTKFLIHKIWNAIMLCTPNVHLYTNYEYLIIV